MSKYIKLGLIIAAALFPSTANAYTVTFDDVPTGTRPSCYFVDNNLYISNAFSVVDYSTSSWGHPHSGNNVLTVVSSIYSPCIRLMSPYYDSSGRPCVDADGNGISINASYFGAYFSTPAGVEIKMSIFKYVGSNLVTTPIAEMTIGSRYEAWNNKLIDYYSNSGEINEVRFDLIWAQPPPPGNSPGILCLDDLTVTPVPEPSSLVTLGLSLIPLASCAMRREKH